jgi:hypothetical protein
MVSGILPGELSSAINNTHSRNILFGDYHYYPDLNKDLRSSDIQGWKFNGDVLPKIIYNATPGITYDTTTIILWAKQKANKTLNITNPLFSTYNNDAVDNQKNPGFYVDTRRYILV